MLYDNVQFILLICKYLKIDNNKYFKDKAKQTISFLNSRFLNVDSNLLGSAFDADSDGEEGKYYVYKFEEIKQIKGIENFFDIDEKGNWEGKIILREIKPCSQEIIDELLKIRNKRKKPFFDSKTQLDLNSLWVSSLVCAHSVMPNEGYLEIAENYLRSIEKKFCKSSLFHSYSKEIVFIEDYAYYIQALIDLADVTMELKYKIKAKEIYMEAKKKFLNVEKNIFQKNQLTSNDLFVCPIDISDNTIPNGNSIMLLNLTRLGLFKEAQILADSLNGYLNNYKMNMISSIKSLDFYNEINLGKKCNEEGCSIE